MKNIETPEKKHLEAIINDLRAGTYGIPDFQRDFEWKPSDVNELIKSIFEDYYIGTLLLWKASSENIEYLSCKPIYGAVEHSKFEHIVLDGQQRLSALYYAFFAPNKNFPKRRSKFYYYIDLEKLLSENYDEAFNYFIASKKTDTLLQDEAKIFEKKIFPLKIFGEKSHNWSRWLENYEKYWRERGFEEAAKTERDKLEGIFESIRNDYYISYIELDREIAVEKVCDIFQRINSTGLDLNIFDLMNALLRPKNIHLKALWAEKANEFNGKLPKTEDGKVYALQTISILKQGYCAPKFLYYLIPNSQKSVKSGKGKLEKVVLVNSSDEFLNLWREAVSGMLNSLKIINNHSDLGVINQKFFPYPTMLPIFTALNVEKNNACYQDRKGVEDKIRFWYWSSIFTKNYSGSVESQLAKDFIEVKTWFLDDNKVPIVVSEARRTLNNLDLEAEESQNSAIYKAIFCILIKEGAKDFETYQDPLYSTLEDHHIVPKSWGLHNHVKRINTILNRTPISDNTNKHIIHDKLPSVYLKSMFDKARSKQDVYDLLESHLISKEIVEILLKEDFGEDDFNRCIGLRRELIIGKIKLLIGG